MVFVTIYFYAILSIDIVFELWKLLLIYSKIIFNFVI